MANTNTTITDKNSFSCVVVDKEKYNNLSQEEKVVFELLRNSMLEIFPQVNGVYTEDTIKYAENFAFINLTAINSFITNSLQSSIATIKNEIIAELSQAANQVNQPNTNPDDNQN